MTGLPALWMPILLSAIAVFFLSSIIHMLSPWHKSDYPGVPREDEVMAALRPFAIPPGDYMVPRPATAQAMRSPAFVEKMQQGPVMVLTVWPNGIASMARNLAMWFVYLVAVGTLAAFVAGRALPLGAPSDRVRQLTGMTAFALATHWRCGRWPFGIADP